MHCHQFYGLLFHDFILSNLPNCILTPLSSVLTPVLCPLSPFLTSPTQVLELCENGELAKYLRDSNRVFSEQEARTIFEQVGCPSF